MSANKWSAVQLGIASPETVKEWSRGEVTKPETINYKTQKPEKDGLFDEVIFGPVKDYECSCGKYKKVKNKGKVCEKCDVEITESIVRRERMGHIELAAPVAHVWFIKELPYPSKISLVLNISYKEVEQVVYFVNYIVLRKGKGRFADFFDEKDVIDLSNTKAVKKARNTLRRLLKEIQEASDKNSMDYQKAKIYNDRLQDSSLPFSIDEIANFINKTTGIEFGIGAEALFKLLKEIDLKKEEQEIKSKLKNLEEKEEEQSRRLLRRLEAITWFKDSTNKPEWMILHRVPVTPPDTRPIIQLDGGKFTTSDVNNLYRRIIIRNERLKRVLELNSPTIIVNNEKRMLQEAVDALFDNASRKKPVVGKDRRPLKSLTDYLKGKQGRFRQNLLGKRVDYSGRSVIAIGPELKLYECGIPAEMILKLFRPFILHELIKKFEDGIEINPIAANIKIAEDMIQRQDKKIWPVVDRVIASRPVLLNRAPTLHRLGIQAFHPKIVEGKAIRLHPLVTPAFNADFDGDQMAVHVPLSDEAVAEAKTLMLASWNILGPKDGKPVITPTQDIVLGNYYLTMERKNSKGEGLIFYSVDEAIRFYESSHVDLHSIVGISTKAFPNKIFPNAGIIVTTIGKIIFNNILPDDMYYVNNPEKIGISDISDIVMSGNSVREFIQNRDVLPALSKKHLSKIADYLYKNYPLHIVPKTMDAIKDLGFKYSTKSGITVSAFDVPSYSEKYRYFDDADKSVERLLHQFSKGLLTDDERYSSVVKIWSDVKDKVSKDIKDMISKPEFKYNSIVIMADSGARGNISNFTQLSGMRGLMSKSFNYDQKLESKVIKDTIEAPIKHSFIEGLTISEYFNSSYGARKGMSDTAMKTSKSGYMTRKLVDATQEVVVKINDCYTTKGIIVSDITDTKTDMVIESIAERIVDRYSINDIYDLKGNIIVKAGEMISAKSAAIIEKNEIQQVEIRSVIFCKTPQGVCQKCFGTDLTTRQEVKIGTAIGVIAAQSIGEPGTQLTMRTFHTGGVSGGANIAQGFERLKQLLDVVPPKEWETAVISEIQGKVTKIDNIGDEYQIHVSNEIDTVVYTTNINSTLRVKKGDSLNPGDKITDGYVNIKNLLLVAGIENVREYIIKEVQKVYRSQGIEISDKYIEVIIKQLTNKIIIRDPGDSKFFSGEVVDLNNFTSHNISLFEQNKKPANGINTIFGLDHAPSKSDSFLSAASFQDTKKILIDAAVKGQKDMLLSLKENVILGQLIPAGSSLIDSKTLFEMADETEDWLY
jgi:DNA-directed RNA polymerase subunit beta'